MNSAVIKTFAVLNVLALAILFVGTSVAVKKGDVSSVNERIVEGSVEVPSDVQLNALTRSRVAWKATAARYGYVVAFASVVITLNGGIFLYSLIGLERPKRKAATEAPPGG